MKKRKKRKKPEVPRDPFRPTLFTKELAATICRRLASGESLMAICREQGMPEDQTVHDWVLTNREGFSQDYARARSIQFERWAEEIMSIADTPEIGEKTVEKATGIEVHRGDMIEARRLKVDARKWLLSKLASKKFGDRMALEHSGSIDITTLDDATLNLRIERKLHDLGVVAMLRSWNLAQDRIEEFLALFRVFELPTAPAPVRLLPGETDGDL